MVPKGGIAMKTRTIAVAGAVVGIGVLSSVSPRAESAASSVSEPAAWDAESA